MGTKSHTIYTPTVVWQELDDLKGGESFNDYITRVLAQHVIRQRNGELPAEKRTRIRRIAEADHA